MLDKRLPRPRPLWDNQNYVTEYKLKRPMRVIANGRPNGKVFSRLAPMGTVGILSKHTILSKLVYYDFECVIGDKVFFNYSDKRKAKR